MTSPPTDAMRPAPALPSSLPAAAWWTGLALLCVLLSLRPIDDADIWFQLLAGRHVLQHGGVPHHEFFLYTSAGQPQLFGGWGFGVLSELAVRAGGWAGLSLFNALLWAAALVLGLLAAQRAAGEAASRRVDWSLAAAMAVALLVAYQGLLHRSQLRAEVTLYLAWMGGTWILEWGRQAQRRRQALAAFPLICWALAWLHTTALLMLPLLASYALRRWLARHEEPLSRPELLGWVLSALASVALPLLNPNGAAQVFAQLTLWNETTADGSNIAETLVNREYVPLLGAGASHLWPAAIALALGTGAWLLLAGPARWPGLVAIAPMVVLALQHSRGIGLWAMALLVPLAVALARTLGPRLAGRPDVAALLTAAGLVALGLTVGSSRYWGVGLAPGGLRGDGAMRLLADKLPQGGPVWAFDAVAPKLPYVLGDTYKVGFAGHMVYRHPEALAHYTQVYTAAPGWDQALRRHGVSLIVVPSMVVPDVAPVPLAAALAWHPRWQLLAIDGQLLVFQRLAPGALMPPEQRLEQAAAFTDHALEMAGASLRFAPDPRTAQLAEQLGRQKAFLQGFSAQPARLDWAGVDRAFAN